MPSHLPSPAELIRIAELLSADEDAVNAHEQNCEAANSSHAPSHALSALALRERDRAIGRDLSELADDPLAQVMAWYRHNHGKTHDAPLTAANRGLTIACLLVGALAGAVTTFGSFFYDGGQRVNVLLILALFCVLPLLSILIFALASCSKDGWATISGGQFGAIIARIIPGQNLTKMAALAAGGAGTRTAKWLLLNWSQWLGLGYGLGALAIAMALVLFTDLAFGWSTTVALSTETVLSTARSVAWPWQAWLPSAVPDEALVTVSRYFRLSTDATIATDPVELARWWPFVVLAMLCYGVLPRFVTLVIAQRRLTAACSDALLNDVHVQRLLQRMNTPMVRTNSLQDESFIERPVPSDVFADMPAADRWWVLNWAAVPVQQSAVEQLLRSSPHQPVVHAQQAAGGQRSSSDDRALIGQLSHAINEANIDNSGGSGHDSDNVSAVLILAKSWEPPTLDLMDFIEELRATLVDSIVVAIMPIALVDGAPTAPSSVHQQTWQHALANAPIGNVHAVALRERTP